MLKLGYYDKEENALHSNSHGENLVVSLVDDKIILAPVDFDFAFTKNSFVNNTDDEERFLHYLNHETWTLFTYIAGTNKNFTIKPPTADLPNKWDVIRKILRSTLASGFQSGYRNIKAPVITLMPNIRALFELTLNFLYLKREKNIQLTN